MNGKGDKRRPGTGYAEQHKRITGPNFKAEKPIKGSIGRPFDTEKDCMRPGPHSEPCERRLGHKGSHKWGQTPCATK